MPDIPFLPGVGETVDASCAALGLLWSVKEPSC